MYILKQNCFDCGETSELARSAYRNELIVKYNLRIASDEECKQAARDENYKNALVKLKYRVINNEAVHQSMMQLNLAHYTLEEKHT